MRAGSYVALLPSVAFLVQGNHILSFRMCRVIPIVFLACVTGINARYVECTFDIGYFRKDPDKHGPAYASRASADFILRYVEQGFVS